jgi:hypothetical protein
MEVRGTQFGVKYNYAQAFFRERRAAPLRTALCSLAFFNICEIPPSLFGAFGLYRLLTVKSGSPGSWSRPFDAVLLANGFVPLAPLTTPPPPKPGEPAVFPTATVALFIGLPILMGIGHYLYSLVTSGKVIRELAASVLSEDSGTVAKTFLTARARIDRKIVFKTLRELKRTDEAKFLEIHSAMQAAETCGRSMQKILGRLKNA